MLHTHLHLHADLTRTNRRKLVTFQRSLSGAFSALQPKADCTLTPKMRSFTHLQRCHAPYRRERPLLAKEGTITKEFKLANPEFTEVLGSFTCSKAGTWDRFFHFPSEGRHAEDYSDSRINPTASAGFEPANSVTRGQHTNH